MIKRLASRELKTKFGTFTEKLYYDGDAESIALVMGDVAGDGVICRVHSHCIGAHVFNSVECTCREEMEEAQRVIQDAGRGVIIWLDQEGKGNGHLALIESMVFKKEHGQEKAYQMAGYSADARRYKPAAQILADLGVRSIMLLASSETKADALRNEGVEVSSVQFLPSIYSQINAI